MAAQHTRDDKLVDVGTAAPTRNPNSPDHPGSGEPRSTARKLIWGLVGLLTIITFGWWIYTLFFYDPGLLIDELEDRSFPTQAEAVCAESVAVIGALPRAEASDDALERADVLDSANESLVQMVARLRLLAPEAAAPGHETIDEWLDDWTVHVEDRLRYAEALREDPQARFTETPKGSKQISRAIDGYAQVNRMTSCETPGDVG